MNNRASMVHLLKAQLEIDNLAKRVHDILTANPRGVNDSVARFVTFESIDGDELGFQVTLHRQTIHFKLKHAVIPDGSGQQLIGQYDWSLVERGCEPVSAGAGMQLHEPNYVLSADGRAVEVYADMPSDEKNVVFSIFANLAVEVAQNALKVVSKH